MATVIASYVTVVDPGTTSLDNVTTGSGQVFTPSATAWLTSVSFTLSKEASPTGNAVAKLYAITGTPGSTAVPTGAALATSANLDVSTLPTNPTTTTATFTFAAYTTLLAAGTYYAIAVEYTGTAVNKVVTSKDRAGTHPGNQVYYASGWNADSARDLPFSVSGDLAIPIFLNQYRQRRA